MTIIDYIESGANYKEAGERFQVSISALGRWYRSYKREGSYEAYKRLGAKRKIDLVGLEQEVQKNADTKLKDLSKQLGVRIYTISYWLRKLGFSYKKKRLPTWKQTKKDERNTWKR